MLDFGCGEGDAFPIYRRRYPRAKLLGVDFSSAAVDRCHGKYGHLAEFLCGDHLTVPPVDVIVASNVLEHVDDDLAVARTLLAKCSLLFVVVPYREQRLIEEHLRSYDLRSFEELRPTRVEVFASKGWSQFGLRPLWWEIRTKNILRPWFGRTQVVRRLQALYQFQGSKGQATQGSSKGTRE